MRRSPWTWVGLLSCAVLLLIGCGVAGWAIGRQQRRGATFRIQPGLVDATPSEGTAYLGAHQPLHRQPYGFAYSFPPAISWTDATGALHEGGRPSCIRYYHAVRVAKMEAVIFSANHVRSGVVLWVQC